MATRKPKKKPTAPAEAIEGFRMPSTKGPIIIGLDISTSVVGVCALRYLPEEPETINTPLYLGWIKLAKFKTLWDKVREVERSLLALCVDLKSKYPGVAFQVAYEEPLIRLSPGGGGAMSSAATITKLSRFNGQVGLLARQLFGDEYPVGLTVHVCRKFAGIKIDRSDSTPHKQQAFRQVCSMIGSDWVVHKNKRDGTTAPRDECLDASDAWVVAAALWNIYKGEENVG